MRVLSGIQPSGIMHLGNYFGAIQQYLELQSKHECLFFIANFHAMTSIHDNKILKENTLQVAIDYLALGLDPEKSSLFIQSDIPELTELTWFFSSITNMGLLERCHSYKDKIANNATPSHALFSYPLLMAADILIYKSNLVPVGKDQIQHLEVTRDVAQSFNHTFKTDIFPLPEGYTPDHVALVPGIDGQKMSKSYENTIPIFGPEKKLRKIIMSIKTDSLEMDDPKDPDSCNIFNLYRLFATEDQKTDLANRYRKGGLGYGHAKQELFELMLDYFSDARTKREELMNDHSYVQAALKKGAEKARAIAIETMKEVRTLVGIN
ncbi:MAG: tryptophan--tRNA ligase [Planctomycetota bacterium]|nr:MAG: tryptophan--tRNA ligase [Planctomycetota bacterium]